MYILVKFGQFYCILSTTRKIFNRKYFKFPF